ESVMITVVDDAGPQAGEIPPVLTGDDGRFEVGGLRRGKYRVAAEGERGAARGATAGVATGDDVTVKLANLARLRGTVTMGGAPVTDYVVTVEGPTHKERQVRDPAGAFTITALDPGHYVVRIHAPAGTGQAEVDVVGAES